MRIAARLGAAAAALVVAAGAAAEATDLIAAVRSGDRAAVATLLDAGADVDARQPDGATALHWAAHHDDLETVQRLLAAGADARAA
ncbi:MAG: ankyrin repeat domain-containing protein, partial [Acidobacteria bacterium]|nr:ankyrin repeat domain-containing protein [Acidobacteriota bacterium]